MDAPPRRKNEGASMNQPSPQLGPDQQKTIENIIQRTNAIGRPVDDYDRTKSDKLPTNPDELNFPESDRRPFDPR